jgi:predicted permease
MNLGLAEQPAPDFRFFLFMGCILVAVVGGYIGRRRGILNPAWVRRTMSGAIIGCDAPIALVAIWFLKMDGDTWKIPVVGAAVGMVVCLLGLWVARQRKMSHLDAPVFGLQAGMGNVGYTLGGAICFMLWGIQGLAVEQIFCMMWPFFAFLFCFPIARHYAETGGGQACPTESRVWVILRTLRQSLLDLRSMPLYAATLGVVLNVADLPPPEFVHQWHLIDAMMVIGILLQFGSVGMTVKASRIPTFWKWALASASFKFILSPVLMLGAALALGMSGTPLYVCVLLAAMPTALYSVLMANLFGLNRDLANSTFILTHAICLTVLACTMAVWHWFY